MLDIDVQNNGSTCLFVPKTLAAFEWVELNIGQDNGWQPYWPIVLVESNYALEILDGMISDGLILG